jgi:GMP synthase (glutamine-hydrolysing)
MITLGILQADSIDTHMHTHSGGDYPKMFQNLFEQAGIKAKIKVYDVSSAQLPGPGSCDGFLITGSRAGSTDGDLWITLLKVFIQDCYEQHTKVIGVCFGHQIIADALGGKVERSHKGWGIGMHQVHIGTQRPWMQPFQDNLSLVFSHRDQVTALPPGAELIAQSEHCAIQMYHIEDRIFGVQGHPEMRKTHSAALIERYQHLFKDGTALAGRESLDALANDGHIVAQWMVHLLTQ